MRLPIKELAGDETLGGTAPGELLLAALLSAIAEKDCNAPIFIDFEEISIATNSFLRVAILGFRSFCRENRPACPIVVANANYAVADELHQLLRSRRDALVTCRLDETGPHEARILGHLDEKQSLALNAVLDLGKADAPTLARKCETTQIGRFTKWNNRLRALVQKGILIEQTAGRSKMYSPVLEGLRYGN